METITAQLQNSSTEANDIFSLSDKVLADHLDFVQEIGFGNWGSVWLCRPKSIGSDGKTTKLGQKLAAKVVHRSTKSPTTAARVRSLWNEMKIVKSFKSDPHPSIIPFHSFIITPSFALITMTFLPTLVPVEVQESKAKEWFHYLLSAIEFLHARGVVHNDIKPANILLSHKNIPVLVDFGFAEKYDMESDTAFHSNLSYGTPEYLSPERARGLPHDTRKSDVWSLGVTFFEILVGRTPFEYSDGEQFSSTDELEKYWARTLRGKWVGMWTFSKQMEKLLQRMIAPNADLRCTAAQAMKDSFWRATEDSSFHKRASSYNSSIAFEKDLEKLLSTPSSRTGDRKEALGGLRSPPGLDIFGYDDSSLIKPTLAKSKSQIVQPRRRALAPPTDLSPIKASPNASPMSSAAAKENIQSFNKLASAVNANNKKNKTYQRSENHIMTKSFLKNKNPNTSKENIDTSFSSVRRPFGALPGYDNIPRPVGMLHKKPSGNTHGMKAVKVLGELDANVSKRDLSISLDGGDSSTRERSKESTNVKERVKEWERERERLREMERLEEMERERDEMYKKEKKEKVQQALDLVIKTSSKGNDKQSSENPLDKKGTARLTSLHEKLDAARANEERREKRNMQIKIPRPVGAVQSTSAVDRPITREKRGSDWDKENAGSSATSPVLPMFKLTSPLTSAILNIGRDTPSSANQTKQSSRFKHSIKASIDKTMQFYKSSTFGQATSGRSTPARGFSFDLTRPGTSEVKSSAKDGQDAWIMADQDGFVPSEVSPLPIIQNAAENERLAAEAQVDRMHIWMRNVEKVVEDAKLNFAAAQDQPLPSLPVPLSRNTSQTRSRLPRRVLAASQIFQSDENGNISPMISDNEQSMMSNAAHNSFLSAGNTSKLSSGSLPRLAGAMSPSTPSKKKPLSTIEGSEARTSFVIPEIHTPSRQRRATVSTRSPEPKREKESEAIVDPNSEATMSPSKRRAKARSHGNLLDRHIAPISVLEAELSKPIPAPPTPRLAEVVDRSLFIAPLLTSRDNLLDAHSFEYTRSPSLDDLTSSPCHVEPYPQRVRSSYDAPIPDTPSRHRIENVYDRFLMATSGVKRVGKGYQSENFGPVGLGTKQTSTGLGPQKLRSHFYSTRRPMPPPVSSEDHERRAASVDELGLMPPIGSTASNKDDSGKTTLMRKAMKMIVPKANTSKRLSRIG